MKLYCIPGGASVASAYFMMTPHLEPDIRIMPLEIAGRGMRSSEPVPESIAQIAADLSGQIANDGEAYGILAFCSGAVIAYELCRTLHDKGIPMPKTLFLSSAVPPDRMQPEQDLFADPVQHAQIRELLGRYFPPVFFDTPEKASAAADRYCESYLKAHHVDSLQFLAEIEESGNTELGNMIGLAEQTMRLIVSEQELLNRYAANAAETDFGFRIPSDLCLISGEHDTFVTKETLDDWRRFCTGQTEHVQIAGSHLAVIEHPDACAAAINQRKG